MTHEDEADEADEADELEALRADGLPTVAVDELALSVARSNIYERLFGATPRPLIAGRFEVEDKLGAGGMGMVWRARDRQLGRTVALKFMLPTHTGDEAETRLLREAQALARIAHPNVVPVYDFGTHEGRVWVAMEHVPGRTLRDAPRRGRSPKTRLEPWIALGRGLAAVHAAGLVHRDVKPDNALVGDDGRVRLIDLGLVCFEADRDSPDHDEPFGSHAGVDSDDATTVEPLHASITRAGVAIGTPAYMGPEQLRSGRASQAADQFSLCVCMVEAVRGARPFAGGSVSERLSAMAAAEHGPLPRRLPRRVRAALQRGLAYDPRRRWPSVDDLLDAIEAAFANRRRRMFGGALVVSLAGAFSIGAARVNEPSQGHEPAAGCEFEASEDNDLALLGDIGPRFAATELPFAERSAAVVEERLRGWDQRWHVERRHACRMTRVHRLQSEATLERQVACLDHARVEFEELARVFASADVGVVSHAGELLGQLPDPAACRRPASIQGPPLSAVESQAIAELVGARAVLVAGDQSRAREHIERAEAALLGVADDSLARLRLRAVEAEFDVQAQRFAAGFPALREIADTAGRAGYADFEASVRVDLAARAAGRWSRPDVERWWLADAELALDRVADADDPRHVDLARTRGLLAQGRGDYAASEVVLGEALALAEARGLASRANDIRMDIANSQRMRGAFDDARSAYSHVLADDLRRWGPQHPRVAHAAHNLGVLEVDAGRFDEATVHLERAVAAYESAWGEDALGALRSRFTLVHIAVSTGRFDEAARALDDLLPRFEAVLGPEHRETAHAYNARGILAFYAGEHATSIDWYERALAAFVAANGEDHHDVGLVACNLGESLLATGQNPRALAAFDRGLPILERRLGRDHPDLGPALKGRGMLRLDSGSVVLAIGDLERALDLLEAADDEPVELAEVRFALARAQRSGGERERADALAREAAVEFELLGLDARAATVRRAFQLR